MAVSAAVTVSGSATFCSSTCGRFVPASPPPARLLKSEAIPYSSKPLILKMAQRAIMRLRDPASLDIVCEQAPTSVTRLNAAFDNRIWVLGFRRHPKGASLKTKSRTCKVVDLRGGRATITFVT